MGRVSDSLTESAQEFKITTKSSHGVLEVLTTHLISAVNRKTCHEDYKCSRHEEERAALAGGDRAGDGGEGGGPGPGQ